MEIRAITAAARPKMRCTHCDKPGEGKDAANDADWPADGVAAAIDSILLAARCSARTRHNFRQHLVQDFRLAVQ